MLTFQKLKRETEIMILMTLACCMPPLNQASLNLRVETFPTAMPSFVFILHLQVDTFPTEMPCFVF